MICGTISGEQTRHLIFYYQRDVFVYFSDYQIMFRQQCEYIIFSFLNLIVSSWALVIILPNFVHNSDILCTVGGVTVCHVVTIFPDKSSDLQKIDEMYT